MPASTLSYQSVASNAIIFTNFYMYTNHNLGYSASNTSFNSVLSIINNVSYTYCNITIKNYSCFFYGTINLILGQIYINSKLIVKSLVILSPLIGLYYFSQTELYENILIAAQLLLFESGELSSLVSRLSIL